MARRVFIFLLVLAQLFVLQVSTAIAEEDSGGMLGLLGKVNVEKVVRSKVAQLTISETVDLINFDIIDGVEIGSKYKYKVTPAYYKNKFTRVDEWTFDTSVRPGDFLLEEQLPIGLSINKGAKVSFYRLFDKQGAAAVAIPYTLANFPLTPEIAIKRLNVGDFVAFQAHMNFVVSKGSSWPVAQYLNFSAGVSYILSGEFLVHVFKLDDDKVRLKVIAVRGSGAGASASGRFSPNFEIFGVSLLDRAIDRIFKVDIASLGMNTGKSDLYMVDYVMDLGKPEVALAYKNLMQAGLRLKSVQIANPLKNEEKLNKDLISDIEAVDRIFRQDRDLPLNERRIDRVFRGKNISHTDSGHYKFNLKVARVNRATTYSKNRIQSMDRQDQNKNYLFNSVVRERESRFVFDFFRKRTAESMSVLITADQQFNGVMFKELQFSLDIEDANLTERNRKKLLRILDRRLSGEVLTQTGADTWIQEADGLLNNAYFKYIVVFNTEALASIPNYKPYEIEDRIDAYLRNTERMKRYYDNDDVIPAVETSPGINPFYRIKREMAERLSEAISNDLTPNERMERFLKIRYNELFHEIGPGFLISLIPETKKKSAVSVQVMMGAKEKASFENQIGQPADRELYNTVQYIQSVLNNRSEDLSLSISENGVINPK